MLFGTATHSFTFTARKSDLLNVSKSTDSSNNGSTFTFEKSILSFAVKNPLLSLAVFCASSSAALVLSLFDEAVLFEGSASLDKISYSFPYDITNYDYLLISAKATSNVTIKESELIKVSDITESDLFVIQYSSTDSFTITFKFQDNTKLYIESIEKSGFNTVEITSITGLMAK